MEEVKSNWQEVVEGSNSAVYEQNPCGIYHNEEQVWPTSSGIFLDESGEIEDFGSKIKNLDIQEFLDSILNSDETENATGKFPPLEESQGDDSHSSRVSVGGVNEIEKIAEDVDKETTGFLEYLDKAVDKLHTHHAHCTNCDSRITKVVLRRAKQETRTSVTGDQNRTSLSFSANRRTLHKQPSVKMLHGTGIPIRSRDTSSKIGLLRQTSSKTSNRRIRLQQKVTEGPVYLENLTEQIEKSSFSPPMGPALHTPSNHSFGISRKRMLDKDSKLLEFIKSIVYGGLMETIASLSVVSFIAASDDDASLILTLGAANLIVGSFVIRHNLLNFKNYGGGSDAKRYQELLGQRKNFTLLATIALLSYLVFGLVPPVLYGFISRRSDDRYYNLKVVAATSFLCVIVLALAKAYTRGECRFHRYLKTVLFYVIIASMASGVGYAAGHFFLQFFSIA